MKLNPIFDVKDFCYSDTAIRMKIDNTKMTGVQLTCLMDLHKLLLDIQIKLTDRFKKTVQININSAFRSKELNDYFIKTIGASKTSQHMDGQAADTTVTGITFDEYFQALKDFAKDGTFKFGQVIKEYGSHPEKSSDDWIHISLPTEKHINEFMKKEPGKPYVTA